MKLGFVVLAHSDLYRTAELVKHLSQEGCAVSLHIDARVSDQKFHKLKGNLGIAPSVIFSERVACDWGRFSIVQATLKATETLFEAHPDVTHVYLCSGSCLPARPISALVNFLEENPKTDFIESVSVAEKRWVVDGLHMERFTLFFPFSWRRHRWWFDKFVDLQRKARVNRLKPDGFEPHLGSQWWCLTAESLISILRDSKRSKYDAYFRWCWIPDESYFQSLVRRHSDKIASKSLTFSFFDGQGKPFTFYDDHKDILTKSGSYFTRKIWPGASHLYGSFLTSDREDVTETPEGRDALTSMCEASNQRRADGGIGRLMQGRFPYAQARNSGPTDHPYGVSVGPEYLFNNLPSKLARFKRAKPFGHIFKRRQGAWLDDGTAAPGNLSPAKKIRDRNIKGFLSNLVWNNKPKRVMFQLAIDDNLYARNTILADPNARIVWIENGWVLRLFIEDDPEEEMIEKARLYSRRERTFANTVKLKKTRARIRQFTLLAALSSPEVIWQSLIAISASNREIRNETIPNSIKFDDLAILVEKLHKYDIKLKITVEDIRTLQSQPTED